MGGLPVPSTQHDVGMAGLDFVVHMSVWRSSAWLALPPSGWLAAGGGGTRRGDKHVLRAHAATAWTDRCGAGRKEAPVLCMVSWPREARQSAGKNWRAGWAGLDGI
jgi:hypothetical protein